MRSRTLLCGIAVFCTACLLRFIYLGQIASSPFFDFLQLDPAYYHDWAMAISRGDWVGSEVFEQSPLYPYLLALYLMVFGHDLYLLRVIQLGIGAVTCVLTYLLGCRMFDRKVGLLAGMGCALYAPYFFYEGQVMKEFLTPPLATGALLLLLARRPFAAGLLIGAAALVRDNFLLLLAVMAAWMACAAGGRMAGRLAAPLPLLAGALVVLLPVGIRNYAVGGDFVLTTSGGGEVFYIGNGPYANGAYVPPPWVRSTPKFEHEDFRKKARELTGREMTRGEASHYWWMQGVRWLAANPGKAALLYMRKFALFWNDHELPDNYSIYTFKKFSWLLAHLLTFGPVAALAWVGAALTWKDRGRLLPLYLAAIGYMVSVILMFNFGRFRLAIVPLLLVMAAKGLTCLWDLATARRLAALAGTAAMLAVILPFVYIDWSSAAEEPFQDRLHLGAAYRQAKRFPEAEATLRQVVQDAESVVRRHGGDPTRADRTPGGVTFVLALSSAHRDLAGALADQKRYAEAVDEYRRAAALAPTDATIHLNMAAALKSAGDLPAAALAYEKAAALDPASFVARFDLAKVYYDLGRLPEALARLEEARRANPKLGTLDLADYHYGMGAVLYAMPGREQEAAGHFVEALALNPAAEQAAEVREALKALGKEVPP